jgi:hypothetical protein
VLVAGTVPPPMTREIEMTNLNTEMTDLNTEVRELTIDELDSASGGQSFLFLAGIAIRMIGAPYKPALPKIS